MKHHDARYREQPDLGLTREQPQNKNAHARLQCAADPGDVESQTEAEDTGGDGVERIGRNQSVMPTQVPETQDDHQTVPDRVSRDGTGDPEPPDPYQGEEKERIRRSLQHGKHRETSEASERRELMFEGDRESYEGNQEKRQMEGVGFGLPEEGGFTPNERDRQCDSDAATEPWPAASDPSRAR